MSLQSDSGLGLAQKKSFSESDQDSLHPNPARSFVNLQYRYPAYNSGDQFRLRIYALDGRILVEQDLPGAAQTQAYELALPGLSAGTYLLTWEVNGERQAYRHLLLQ